MKMPSTVFIALQCCQCSMMQVKQRKKSSNKWTCSVCNQRQSVRKVFAQGDFARDLRKFVQEFNLKQKDQTLTLDRELNEEGEEEESRIETEMTSKKLKLNNNGGSGSDASKWNGYITQDDDMEEKWKRYITQDDDTELNTSKKLKLNNNGGSGSDASKWKRYITQDDDMEQKWKRYITQDDDMELNACPKAKAAVASKWLEYMTRTEEDGKEQRIHGTLMVRGDSNSRSCRKQVDSKADGSTSGGEQRTRQPAVMRKSASNSKWNYYLTQEGVFQATVTQDRTVEDDDRSNDHDQSNGVFHTITHDQTVEDDIHPDFI